MNESKSEENLQQTNYKDAYERRQASFKKIRANQPHQAKVFQDKRENDSESSSGEDSLD